MFSRVRSVSSIARNCQLNRNFSVSTIKSVAVGDKIPSVQLFEGSPGNEFSIPEDVSSGKAVVIGVPGAFSPACSASHVPGYIKSAASFKEKGYDKLYVVAVNDPFVTKAWGESLVKDSYVNGLHFLADPKGEFTKELDLLFDASKVFGNERSKRYALVVEDGKVSKTFIEPDNVSVDVSDASKVLENV